MIETAQTETTRPKRPDRIGHTEAAGPNRPDRKGLFRFFSLGGIELFHTTVIYRNVVTELSPDQNGQTEMSCDRNGPDRNGSHRNGSERNDQTESAIPKPPDQIGQTEKACSVFFHWVVHWVVRRMVKAHTVMRRMLHACDACLFLYFVEEKNEYKMSITNIISF